MYGKQIKMNIYYNNAPITYNIKNKLHSYSSRYQYWPQAFKEIIFLGIYFNYNYKMYEHYTLNYLKKYFWQG